MNEKVYFVKTSRVLTDFCQTKEFILFISKENVRTNVISKRIG